MYTQLSFFDVWDKPFKIEKPIKLIELFAGYGSQHMALSRLAEEGDGCDISSRMATHRGTVQKGMSLTIKTSIDVGVVEIEDIT